MPSANASSAMTVVVRLLSSIRRAYRTSQMSRSIPAWHSTGMPLERSSTAQRSLRLECPLLGSGSRKRSRAQHVLHLGDVPPEVACAQGDDQFRFLLERLIEQG